MNTQKPTSKTKGKKQQKDKPEPIIEKDIQAEEDIWEEEDEDFGGLKAPDDFKKQLGCGG